MSDYVRFLGVLIDLITGSKHISKIRCRFCLTNEISFMSKLYSSELDLNFVIFSGDYRDSGCGGPGAE